MSPTNLAMPPVFNIGPPSGGSSTGDTMGSRVEIKFTETDEFDQEKVVTYSQNNVYCTEDLEYAFVKAAMAIGFDDYFFGYSLKDVFREVEDD